MIKEKQANSITTNNKLLNKYKSVREIFDRESKNIEPKIIIKESIPELENIDIKKLKSKDAKKLANNIFEKYHDETIFSNNKNKITVSRTGINESIEKIYNSENQRNLLEEHLKIFSSLGSVINNSTLVNQCMENKNRFQIKLWNYYFDKLIIDGKIYDFAFDVRTLESGDNQYRVQRLEKTGVHSGDVSKNTKILPALEQPVSEDNIS